ncbi:hypothetical protein DICPUDRAFT_12023, partial [Dictyostelium purpureum]
QIYDQDPSFNPNFESREGVLTKGLVKENLNPLTKIPELLFLSATHQNNIKGGIVKPDLFKFFFSTNHDPNSPGYNIAKSIILNLTYDKQKDVYVIDNQSFFPLDNRGLDANKTDYKYFAPNNIYHNYHFCLKINNQFAYQGFEEFTFEGGDDFYLFINNKLVIDLGGIHTSQKATVYLNVLNLIKYKVYPIDLYFCQRHTTRSTIRIETNIEMFCAFYDFCGVCNGDGSTCCNPNI